MKKAKEMKLGLMGVMMALLVCLLWVTPVKVTAGPTGGYLIGFIFMAIVSGWIIDRFPGKYLYHALGLVLGTIICYAFGTIWLARQLNMTFIAGLGVGVIPDLHL